MWGQNNKKSKQSEFFKGANLSETLSNSFFGKFRDIIKELSLDDTEISYKLPAVYVIGNESTGKSSLLENITKCQIFPRDSKICTKCPIHVIMSNGKAKYVISYYEPSLEMAQQKPTEKFPNSTTRKLIRKELVKKTDIYNAVLEFMNKFSQDTISDEELIIEITDENLPNFEFYDLPGIRTYPKETAIATINLCKKYLSADNSIILCVVPATTTRLTSCQSIALISEMGLQQNCILALTMADRLQMENIEELLINRILGCTDELDGLNFAGCISVVNRVHSDVISLEENDDNEKKWFSENILNCIPDGYKQYENKIKDNITISNLLRQMDALYSKYINTNWKPRVLSEINDLIQKLDVEYENLGDIVDEELTDEINKLINKYVKSIYDTEIHEQFYQKYKMFNNSLLNKYEEYYAILENINKMNDYYVQKDHKLIVEKIKNDIKNIEQYKMYRFEKAITSLGEKIFIALCGLSGVHMGNIKKMTIDCLTRNVVLEDRGYSSYEHIFSEYYKLFVLYPVFNLEKKFLIEDLEENDEHKEHRKRIIGKITNSQKSYSTIKNLEI